MGFCIAGLVGDCGGGAETRNNVENDILHKNVMNALQENSTKVTNSVIASQRIKIKAGRINCKTFKVANVMKGHLRFVSAVTQKLTTDIKAAFDTAINQGIEAESKDKRELLSSPSNTATINDIKNKLHNIVERSITNRSLAEIVNKFNLEQIVDIEVGVIEGADQCDVKQTMLLDIMATNIIEQVSGVAANDQSLASLITKAKAAGFFESKGLNSIVDSVVGFFTSAIGMYAIIIIVIIISIAVILKSAVGTESSSSSPQYIPPQVTSQQQFAQQPQYIAPLQ